MPIGVGFSRLCCKSLVCIHKSDPVLRQYAWDNPESPHVETVINRISLMCLLDAINRVSTKNLLVNYGYKWSVKYPKIWVFRGLEKLKRMQTVLVCTP